MLEAVIFDMDGVIIDSEDSFFQAKDTLLNELGISVDSSYHHQFMGTTAEYTWTKMKEELAISLSVEECIKRMEAIRKDIIKRDGLRPIPGVLDLIMHLHKQGVPLAIASSSPLEDIYYTVEIFQLNNTFQVLVTGQDCENSKPFPDVFLKAAKELDVKPANCLVIEDSQNGTLAAKAAGMTCIGYNNPEFNNMDLSKADKIVEYFKDINIDICKEMFLLK
ncbi:HAD family phosphatase [Neobacillus novalis]|uniref:HAD family phosphatase n=1 Tax=Neobacillus novalis TaxID=220687 RepID=A0AA95MRA1_9BACI|nr:HAD family phosphatase [Neobacillus novalis]WHY86543.1 HAD family phosphatase [Neobacillus novalis]